MNDVKKKPYEIAAKGAYITITTSTSAVRFPAADLYAVETRYGDLLLTLKDEEMQEFVELIVQVSADSTLVPHGSWEAGAVTDVFAAKSRSLTIQLLNRKRVFSEGIKYAREHLKRVIREVSDLDLLLELILVRGPSVLDARATCLTFLHELEEDLLGEAEEDTWRSRALSILRGY